MDELRASPPALHGEAEFWGLAWEALAFIERTVRPGMATLETGAGASTIVFAASGAHHETGTPTAAGGCSIISGARPPGGPGRRPAFGRRSRASWPRRCPTRSGRASGSAGG